MFKTKVHQTLTNKENPDYIEDNGPFQAENIPNTYLGSGYYFWDDHEELAHWWGKVHCGNDYVICEGQMMVEKDLFFDLVGCRQDQIYFRNAIQKLGLEKMAIGKVIEMLKDINSRPNKKGTFPFKVIRAMDTSNSTYKQDLKKFSENRTGMTSLTPQMIICLIEKNKVILSSYKIIHPPAFV